MVKLDRDDTRERFIACMIYYVAAFAELSTLPEQISGESVWVTIRVHLH